MARAAPGSAQGDFFIIVGGLPALDAQAAGEGDIAGYAVFGRVVEGMEVVKAILAAPVDPDAGEGAMKGQMIAAPVPILRATRLP
jgi:peptidyl-prolyl cis-trans isomerase A (cyclophilin A)